MRPFQGCSHYWKHHYLLYFYMWIYFIVSLLKFQWLLNGPATVRMPRFAKIKFYWRNNIRKVIQLFHKNRHLGPFRITCLEFGLILKQNMVGLYARINGDAGETVSTWRNNTTTTLPGSSFYSTLLNYWTLHSLGQENNTGMKWFNWCGWSMAVYGVKGLLILIVCS